MAELAFGTAAIVACHGQQALRTVAAAAETAFLVVAPDEVLLVDGSEARSALVERATRLLALVDPHGLAVDESDAWAVASLTGEDREDAFARLSALSLPAERPGRLKGAVAGLPARVLVHGDRIDVLVPSPGVHNLRERGLASGLVGHGGSGAEA